MNVLDLFSGIGGFSLGLERAGMRTVAFCEINPFGRRLLAERWPGIPCYEDITQTEFYEGQADVICGGFPCQDISDAGHRAGLAGERSGLWRELLRAIRVVRPFYAIVENVAALLTRGMGTVLGDLAEIGYDAEWHCIPASAVGAPHRRDRVWIIADPAIKQHKGNRTPLSGAIAAQFPYSNTNQDGRERRKEPDCKPQQPQFQTSRRFDAERFCSALADTSRELFYGSGAAGARRWGELTDSGRWTTEPDVGRVAHGIPARVDRLKGLGNAVVPQIPEAIGRAIMMAINQTNKARAGDR